MGVRYGRTVGDISERHFSEFTLHHQHLIQIKYFK